MSEPKRPGPAWSAALVLAAVIALPCVAAPPENAAVSARARDLVLIDVAEQDRLIAQHMQVTWKGASFFLAEWDAAEQELARSRSIRFQVLLPRIAPDLELFLFELHEGEQPPAAWAPHTVFRQGVKTVVVMDDPTARSWEETGYHSVRIGREPRGFEAPAPRAFNCSPQPVVTELLARMDSARWIDWIEKISGVEPVEVGGVTAPITTRHSTRLFSGHAHARAFDFLEQQVGSWHYGVAPASIEIDGFSGNSVQEGATWKNLVLTLPGQGLPSDLVLLTAHFDSRAVSSPSQQQIAPGADDNGTGSAILFEAARLLRQFRFERTIKIVWFTGEEQSLLGSDAYVDDHPLASILGVVNVDMAGYDGNGDRCFEIHVGTLAQSDVVGQCFAASTDLYSPTLNYDYLTVGATDRSDHASFWNASTPVGAIEIAENFFSTSSPGGCVGADTNPNYHTPTDTTAAVTTSFGFDIARAALATVAAMAVPVQACFAGSPVLAATPGTSVVDLSWSAVPGATTYRVYRSKQGCQGQWTELGQTAGTSWPDTLASDPVTYSYHVEAVASDGFCVSQASNCASAQPTVVRGRIVGSAPADTCAAGGPGSGDGLLDPGETATLPLGLLNDGNTSLTAITGLASSASPGVSAADPYASWPDLGPSQSALSLPDHVTIHVGGQADCGAPVDLDLALDYDQGANATALALPTGGATTVTLLSASFAGGLPAGFGVVDGGSGGGAAATWTTANPGARSIGAPFAAPFAIVDSGAAGSAATQNEQLVTPAVDASSCLQVSLVFSNQFNYDTGAPYEFADVDVSTDGGTNWTSVLHLQAEDDGFSTPNTKTVDITSAIAADPSNVRVRFRYHQGQNDLWWAVDNVRIDCAEPVCQPCLVGSGPPGEAGTLPRLTVRRDAGVVVFHWGAPGAGCGALDYALYRGDLLALRTGTYAHDSALGCAEAGNSLAVALSDPRLGEADYFLVVAGNGTAEGSYGRATGGTERPRSAAACLAVQDLASCGP